MKKLSGICLMLFLTYSVACQSPPAPTPPTESADAADANAVSQTKADAPPEAPSAEEKAQAETKAQPESKEGADKVSSPAPAAAREGEADWVELFDGETLKGWRINENPQSWTVRDGHIVANGERSHAFYITDEPFVDFELEAEIMTRPNSNSGIYFHTRFQPDGWPKYGFEVQVNNSYDKDPQRTGSLYGVVKNTTPPAKDDEWFTMNVKVKGKRVTVTVNGDVVAEYREPADHQPGKEFTRHLDRGTFALQAHDPESEVHFKRIRVRRL